MSVIQMSTLFRRSNTAGIEILCSMLIRSTSRIASMASVILSKTFLESKPLFLLFFWNLLIGGILLFLQPTKSLSFSTSRLEFHSLSFIPSFFFSSGGKATLTLALETSFFFSSTLQTLDLKQAFFSSFQ